MHPQSEFAPHPVAPAERILALDVIRGAALFGVLIVNLLTIFRVSIFDYIGNFHPEANPAGRAIDFAVACLLEFKAFALFSFLFGVGISMQAAKPGAHACATPAFLARRFALLGVIGLAHVILIWNGDILTLYAVCAFVILPFLRLPSRWLAGLAVVAITLSFFPPYPVWFPSVVDMRADVDEANLIYAQGSWLEILRFRWKETTGLILPLLISAAPKTLGLMLLGVVTGRSGLFQNPSAHRATMWRIAWVGGAVGLAATAVNAGAALRNSYLGRWHPAVEMLSIIPLALAYGAWIVIWVMRSATPGLLLQGLAAIGRMALTNYLTQSVLLGFIFYGYGLGQFGKMPVVPALGLGLGLYTSQTFLSLWWLRRFRMGPVEWLWRSGTYGKWQQFRLNPTST